MRTHPLPTLLLSALFIACNGSSGKDDTGGLGDGGSDAVDADGDGFTDDEDCDDSDASIHPDAEEVCDGVDNNCDDDVDGSDATGATEWLGDGDGDGFGDPVQSITACDPPSNTVAAGDEADCDDTDDAVFPGAEEVCNGVDDDCDTELDEGLAITTWYSDADTDGYGDPTVAVESCGEMEDMVADNTDCDDTEITVNPGATEVCNDGLDNDCDGTANDCGLPTTGTAADATASISAETNNTFFGNGMDGGGDVDGDGNDDFLIGDPYLNDGHSQGNAYLFSGPLTGTLDAATDAIATFPGEDVNANDLMGFDVAMAGDIDGDGYDDVLVTAQGVEVDGMAWAGRVYLHHGPLSGTVAALDAEMIVSGTDTEWGLASLTMPTDLTGDGVVDLVVGSYWYGNYRGAAYVVAGPLSGNSSITDATFSLRGETNSDYLGDDVDAADLNGDGIADLVTGGRTWDNGSVSAAGGAFVQFGPVSGHITDSGADATFAGESTTQYLGGSQDAGSDMDGDGHPDLLLGAEGHSSATGGVYLFRGPLSANNYTIADADAFVEGERTDDHVGFNLDARGDYNNDGAADMVVNACCVNAPTRAYVVFGPLSGTTSLTDADVKLQGDSSGVDGFAMFISYAGDVDGQGVDDLAIAKKAYTSGVQSQVFFFSGGGM
jgi:hypothetical protein